MSAIADSLNKAFGSLADRTRVEDPLKAALVRRSVTTALLLALGVGAWLLLANLFFTRVVYSPQSTTPGADLVLQEASASVDEVMRFAQSPESVPDVVALSPSYPDGIVVAPVAISSNPFGSFAPKATVPKENIGNLIRERQQVVVDTPIVIRGILGTNDRLMAVLASNSFSSAVRPGDAFMDWQVLAVRRDRVLLKKNGTNRTITWEGNE